MLSQCQRTSVIAAGNAAFGTAFPALMLVGQRTALAIRSQCPEGCLFEFFAWHSSPFSVGP